MHGVNRAANLQRIFSCASRERVDEFTPRVIGSRGCWSSPDQRRPAVSERSINGTFTRQRLVDTGCLVLRRPGCFRPSDRLAGWDSHPLEIADFHGLLSFRNDYFVSKGVIDGMYHAKMSSWAPLR